MLTTTYIRFFCADVETGQIDGHTNASAVAGAYYYEPADYEGDVLYSAPYTTPEAAVQAAIEDAEERDAELVDGPWLDELVAVAEGAGWEARAARALIVGLDPDAAARAASARAIATALGVSTPSH